jgi:hypothetical protein
LPWQYLLTNRGETIMRTDSLALSLSLALLLASGSSIAGRYGDQPNIPSSHTRQTESGSTYMVVGGGRGADQVGTSVSTQEASAEFAVMEVTEEAPQGDRILYLGGRPADARISIER